MTSIMSGTKLPTVTWLSRWGLIERKEPKTDEFVYFTDDHYLLPPYRFFNCKLTTRQKHFYSDFKSANKLPPILFSHLTFCTADEWQWSGNHSTEKQAEESSEGWRLRSFSRDILVFIAWGKMGLLTILKKMRQKEKEMRLLILGLDNAGKTTILKKFNGEEIDSISPTLGFNIQTLEHRGYKLNCWDVGGQKSLRSYWRNYFEQTDGLIWVVDSADRMRLEVSFAWCNNIPDSA